MHKFTIKTRRALNTDTFCPEITITIKTSQEYIQDSMALGKNEKQMQILALISELEKE